MDGWSEIISVITLGRIYYLKPFMNGAVISRVCGYISSYTIRSY